MLEHYLNCIAYCVISSVSQHSPSGIILWRNSRMGPREAHENGRHSVVATIWKQNCFFSLLLLLFCWNMVPVVIDFLKRSRKSGLLWTFWFLISFQPPEQHTRSDPGSLVRNSWFTRTFWASCICYAVLPCSQKGRPRRQLQRWAGRNEQ